MQKTPTHLLGVFFFALIASQRFRTALRMLRLPSSDIFLPLVVGLAELPPRAFIAASTRFTFSINSFLCAASA
jgi:hypothetical protein